MRPLLLVPLFALAACSTPVTVRDDASTPSDASSSCDPHREPCRVTLSCEGSSCEGVQLATGTVVSFEGTRPSTADVSVYVARYLGLSSSSDICRFGESVGTGTQSFASLREVPADTASCSFESGPNLLCGVNASTYTPSCLGSGLLVRDASMQLYRLRVIEDRYVGSRGQIELEWMAID